MYRQNKGKNNLHEYLGKRRVLVEKLRYLHWMAIIKTVENKLYTVGKSRATSMTAANLKTRQIEKTGTQNAERKQMEKE